MNICAICNKQCKNIQSLSRHLNLVHNLNTVELKKQYYDVYIKKEKEGICPKCKNPTQFKDLTKGYNKYCCKSCQVSMQGNKINHNKMWKIKKQNIENYEKEHNCTHISTIRLMVGKTKYYNAINDLQIPIIKLSKMYQYISNIYIDAIKNYNSFGVEKAQQTINNDNIQFEIDNNCTQIHKLISQYGQGWLSLDLPKIEKNHNAHFISNKYIPIIKEYASKNHSYRSKKECQLYETITNIYKHTVYHNSRNIIPHYELDIYIPELKIAFEFNGIKWHSIENGMDKDYHLNKSLICRQNGIRLVHIYEFEDFNEQLNLAKQLVQGFDYYNKNDFNKNNLLDFIPKAEIVYKNNYYTIYGAGLLYK